MAGVAGQHRELDTELAEGALPFALELGVEHDRIVGGGVQPAVLLELAVELARSPAGIAERQQALARPLATADGAQDLERCGEGEIVADGEQILLGVIRRVQHEAAPQFDRSTEMKPAAPR